MDTLNRFSDRVESYIKYRPDYPTELISFFSKEIGMDQNSVIADIGSGTGISSELFLKNGNKVIGVEPNKEMRSAAERLLSTYEGFTSVAATAEKTDLEKESVDVIVAGQAFHWFDKAKCKEEFKRILKKNGTVVLIWNDRRTDSTEFLRTYEDFIIKHATDYLEVNHKNLDDEIFDDFFGKGKWKTKAFDNFQYFDLGGLKGRILSSSYMPAPGTSGFEPMMAELEKVFDQFKQNEKVTIEYDTRIFYGSLE